MHYISVIFIIFVIFKNVSSHAYLADPPSRSSAWLFDKDFQECCTYFNHMEMFCGGMNALWLTYGGQCGICGEVWNSTKQFEKGGSKYLGKIVRNYKQADAINISVVITANHYGYFEFRICNVDGWENDANQACLNKTILPIANSTETRLFVRNYSSPALVRYQVQLPQNLTCKRCVIQWKYVGGNRWGTDEITKKNCTGCGLIQEHFYGCADVAILPFNETLTSSSSELKTTTKETSTSIIVKGLVETKETSTITTIAKSKINSFDGCSSKLYFGDTVNLSKVVAIFCSRVCKPTCFQTTDTALLNSLVCQTTCLLLCDCNINEQK